MLKSAQEHFRRSRILSICYIHDHLPRPTNVEPDTRCWILCIWLLQYVLRYQGFGGRVGRNGPWFTRRTRPWLQVGLVLLDRKCDCAMDLMTVINTDNVSSGCHYNRYRRPNSQNATRWEEKKQPIVAHIDLVCEHSRGQARSV